MNASTPMNQKNAAAIVTAAPLSPPHLRQPPQYLSGLFPQRLIMRLQVFDVAFVHAPGLVGAFGDLVQVSQYYINANDKNQAIMRFT